jgi:hypothetical protein
MKKSFVIQPSAAVGREEQSLETMMVAVRTAGQNRESYLARLSEASEIDEFILTEMCKEVAALFGEDVEQLEKMSVNVIDVMRKSLYGVTEDWGDGSSRFSMSNGSNAESSTADSGPLSFLQADAEEQKKLLEFFEKLKKKQQEEKEGQERQKKIEKETKESQEVEEKYTDMVELEPGVSLPLRSYGSTFRAILTGKTTTATCFGCQQTLTTPSDVAFVICSDCWVCVALDQPSDADPSKRSIGLGVKDEGIANWLAKRNSTRS